MSKDKAALLWNSAAVVYTVKSQLLAALIDKPQAQIMCQKSGKTLIPIVKLQVYFVDVVKCVNEVCEI